MQTRRASLRLLLLGLCCLFVACSAKGPKEILDFRLLDSQGKSWQLSRAEKLWVLSPQLDPGKIAHFETLAESQSELAEFFYLQDRPLADWPSKLPVLLDPTLIVAEQLGLKKLNEVIAITKDGSVKYRGASSGLKAALEGQSQTWVEAKGSSPLFPSGTPSFDYRETVAPIVQQRCLGCHSQGRIAPFAFDSHSSLAKRKSMLKEVLLTGRMPPWQIDPSSKVMHKSLSLTPLEKRALISWIDGGALPSDGADPLHEASQIKPEHTPERKPDLVLTPEEALSIPPDGLLEYQYLKFQPKLAQDVYVEAVHFKPGDSKAVHHGALIYSDSGQEVDFNSIDFLRKELMTFNPTMFRHITLEEETGVPESGILLPKNSDILIQLHLTTYGKASTFKPSVELFFAKEKPRTILKPLSFVNPSILIPAGAKNHKETASLSLERDSIIYGLFPHMHYRGVSAKFEIGQEMLLKVPKYDFNWQHSYWLKDGLSYPAGTEIKLEGIFDNSAQNPQNPDPTKDVRFGIQSQDEMLYGTVFVEER